MKRTTFLAVCAAIAAAAISMAAVLSLVLGGAWFSYYGWAAVVLTAVIPFSVALWVRARAQRVSRWPILLFAVPVIAIALVQIGFWLAFFSTGVQGLPLGFARALLRPYLDPALIGSTIVFGAFAYWLFSRAAKTHCSTQKNL